MRNDVIADRAIYDYSEQRLNVVRKAAKTLRRLHPHYIEWYEELLCYAADVYRLNKKLYMGDLLIDIYPASKPRR